MIARKIDKIKRSFKLHKEAHTEHRPEQSDATGNGDSEGSGKGESAMPEQPDRAQGERVQARSHFVAGVAFLPGQGFTSGLKVLRAQSRACLPLAFDSSVHPLKTSLLKDSTR